MRMLNILSHWLLHVCTKTGPLFQMFCMLIINQQLSMFAIPLWLILSRLHNTKPAPPAFGGLLENVVNFFKGAVCGLWVEEVYDREDECISMEC